MPELALDRSAGDASARPAHPKKSAIRRKDANRPTARAARPAIQSPGVAAATKPLRIGDRLAGQLGQLGFAKYRQASLEKPAHDRQMHPRDEVPQGAAAVRCRLTDELVRNVLDQAGYAGQATA